MKDKTRHCGCQATRFHLGNGVYKCEQCGHVWDTWDYCAPSLFNEELYEIVRSQYRIEGDDEE